MALLILGVAVWSVTHISKAAAVDLRKSMVERLGGDRYRGVFSLVVVASLVCMVLGWRSATPGLVYAPPLWGRHATMILMLIALVLFAAASMPTNIKRTVRHPQMTGVIIWSIGHLLSNGDSRSLVLFGGLGLWAVAEIVFINRRDGAWNKQPPQPRSADAKVVAGGLVGYVILYFAHPYLFGVSPM